SEPLVPTRLLGALDGCAEVRVLAQPPLAGAPRLLPPHLAWSYQVTTGGRTPDLGGAQRRVVVAGSTPPPWLALPSLGDWESPGSARASGTVVLRGAEAQPGRVLAEIADATEVQFHVHAVGDLRQSDAPVLALTPDAAGHWGLSAEGIRAASLR